MFDIWKPDQRNKILSIKNLLEWWVVSNIGTYLFLVLVLISVYLVSDVGDAIAIFDGYPIFIPFFGLCVKHTLDDWKHRYFVCLILIIISVMLISQPNYSSGSESEYEQIIGCLIALSSAIMAALTVLATTMLKKLSYFDLIKQENINAEDETGDKELKTAGQMSEETPLKNATDLRSIDTNDDANNSYKNINDHDDDKKNDKESRKIIEVEYIFCGQTTVPYVTIVVTLTVCTREPAAT